MAQNLALRKLIVDAGKIEVQQSSEVVALPEVKIEMENGRPINVQTQDKLITKVFENIVVFDPDVNNLFPGNIVKGGEADKGRLVRLGEIGRAHV